MIEIVRHKIVFARRREARRFMNRLLVKDYWFLHQMQAGTDGMHAVYVASSFTDAELADFADDIEVAYVKKDDVLTIAG